MEPIIKKAIEGGWLPSSSNIFTKAKNKKEVLEAFQYCYPDEESIKQHRHYFEYFSNPLFWQALGKGCNRENNKECNKCGYAINGWKGMALRFHEINLTEGWDKAVNYLEELVR